MAAEPIDKGEDAQTSQERQMICPDCQSKLRFSVRANIVKLDDGRSSVEMKCATCNGTGETTDAQALAATEQVAREKRRRIMHSEGE